MIGGLLGSYQLGGPHNKGSFDPFQNLFSEFLCLATTLLGELRVDIEVHIK
jgi:hypothetical protein